MLKQKNMEFFLEGFRYTDLKRNFNFKAS
ncbi:hypothetical protein [Chryseobacterium bernardetii]